jgi:site-specific recombinase XerD
LIGLESFKDRIPIGSDMKHIAFETLAQTVAKIEGAYAPSTIRAYRSDFAEFIGFCEEDGSDALPAEPETLARFITKLSNSGRTSASIRRAVAGIGTIHRLNRFVDPSKDPDESPPVY